MTTPQEKPSRGRKILLFTVLGLVALVVIMVALPSGGDEDDTPIATEASEPESETSPPAEDADTGRMSDGEFGLFERQVSDIDTELNQYSEQLPKCAVLIQAQALADASTCISDAYDGLEGDMLGAYASVENLESDVAKGCLKALRLYKQRLDVFFGYMKTTNTAGANLQFEEFSVLANDSTRQARRYRQAKGWALDACAPV
jgi:hypothetical protein